MFLAAQYSCLLQALS